MKTLAYRALITLGFAFALTLRVGVAAPALPAISVSDDGTRAIARYGVAVDLARQSKLAVKELSRLIKKYPDAREWAVAYNTAPKYWTVIEYDFERRQLMQVIKSASESSNRRGLDFYPSHIHRAAQLSLTIEELWKIKDFGAQADGY